MIPKTTSDPILKYLKDYTAQNAAPPSILEIEAAANFRAPGGLTRCLTALREVALLHLRGAQPAADAVDRVLAALKAHGFDDGDGFLIVCSPDEARKAISSVLA